MFVVIRDGVMHTVAPTKSTWGPRDILEVTRCDEFERVPLPDYPLLSGLAIGLEDATVPDHTPAHLSIEDSRPVRGTLVIAGFDGAGDLCSLKRGQRRALELVPDGPHGLPHLVARHVTMTYHEKLAERVADAIQDVGLFLAALRQDPEGSDDAVAWCEAVRGNLEQRWGRYVVSPSNGTRQPIEKLVTEMEEYLEPNLFGILYDPRLRLIRR